LNCSTSVLESNHSHDALHQFASDRLDGYRDNLPDRRVPTSTAAATAITIMSMEFASVGTDRSGLRRHDNASESSQSGRQVRDLLGDSC
jgi:hypothetical protein